MVICVGRAYLNKLRWRYGYFEMLTGKKCPRNKRALRVVVKELIRGHITTGEFQTYSQLMKALEDQTSQSRTSKL